MLGWHNKEELQYGKGVSGLLAGAGKSFAQAVGNGSSEDMEQGGIDDSMKSAESANKKSGALSEA